MTEAEALTWWVKWCPAEGVDPAAAAARALAPVARVVAERRQPDVGLESVGAGSPPATPGLGRSRGRWRPIPRRSDRSSST